MRILTTSMLLGAALTSGCGNQLDRDKFNNVSRAGHAFRLELASTGCGGASPRCEDLIKAFQLEVAALQGRTDNASEAAALSAYAEAADAYQFFVRVRALEVDAVASGLAGDKILVDGTNEVAAKRFKVPIQTVGSAPWAATSDALKISEAHGAQQFAEAERIVTGGAG